MAPFATQECQSSGSTANRHKQTCCSRSPAGMVRVHERLFGGVTGDHRFPGHELTASCGSDVAVWSAATVSCVAGDLSNPVRDEFGLLPVREQEHHEEKSEEYGHAGRRSHA